MSSCKHSHLLTQLTFGSSSTTAMSDVFDPKELEGLMTEDSDCEFLLDKVWNALDRPRYKNPLYDQIFSSVEDVHEIGTQTKFRVTDGLVDAMTAESPPHPDYWKTLPRKLPGKSWGVYNVHMEKEGKPPRDYFGSATESNEGFERRATTYEPPLNLEALPKYVAESIREGYRITHMGVLVYGPLPTAAQVPKFRVFYVAVEATLTLWFGGLRHRPQHPADVAACGWNLGAFRYEGLCSHSAFLEAVRGNFNLTAEQLETLAAERKAEASERDTETSAKSRHLKLLQDPYAAMERSRELYALKREHTYERERLNQESREKAVAFRAKNPEKPQEYRQTAARRVLLSRECWCDPCGTDSTTKGNFLIHLDTIKHKKCIIRVAEGRHLQHRYYLCHSSFDDLRALKDHEKKDAHKKNAAAPDAVTTAKAARAKAIADRPEAIKAAKAAILACNGDFSKAISKFNTELDPVDLGPPEVFDFTQPPKAVPDDIQPQPQPQPQPKTTDTVGKWFFQGRLVQGYLGQGQLGCRTHRLCSKSASIRQRSRLSCRPASAQRSSQSGSLVERNEIGLCDSSYSTCMEVLKMG
jgi:hypothetical protein